MDAPPRPPAAFTVPVAPPRPAGHSVVEALRHHEPGVRAPRLVETMLRTFHVIEDQQEGAIFAFFSAHALLDAAMCAWPRRLRQRDAGPLSVAAIDLTLHMLGGKFNRLTSNDLHCVLGCTAAVKRHPVLVAEMLGVVGFVPLVRSVFEELVAAIRYTSHQRVPSDVRRHVFADATVCLHAAVADPVLADMSPRDLACAALEIATRVHVERAGLRPPGPVAVAVWERVAALLPEMPWTSKHWRKSWRRQARAMTRERGGSAPSSTARSVPPTAASGGISSGSSGPAPSGPSSLRSPPPTASPKTTDV